MKDEREIHYEITDPKVGCFGWFFGFLVLGFLFGLLIVLSDMK